MLWICCDICAVNDWPTFKCTCAGASPKMHVRALPETYKTGRTGTQVPARVQRVLLCCNTQLGFGIYELSTRETNSHARRISICLQCCKRHVGVTSSTYRVEIAPVSANHASRTPIDRLDKTELSHSYCECVWFRCADDVWRRQKLIFMCGAQRRRLWCVCCSRRDANEWRHRI